MVLDPDGNVVFQNSGGSVHSMSSYSVFGSDTRGRGYVVPSPNEIAALAASAGRDARLERLRLVREQEADKARGMVERRRQIQGARRAVARGAVMARLEQSNEAVVSGLVERADDALNQVGMAYTAALEGSHSAVLEAQDAQVPPRTPHPPPCIPSTSPPSSFTAHALAREQRHGPATCSSPLLH